MLCGLFNLAGFLIIITQNRKFNKNDKAAITPNITSLALASELWSSMAGVDGSSFEIFFVCEGVIRFSILNSLHIKMISLWISLYTLNIYGKKPNASNWNEGFKTETKMTSVVVIKANNTFCREDVTLK